MNGKFSSRRGEGVKSGNGDKERIMGMQVWGKGDTDTVQPADPSHNSHKLFLTFY